MRRFAWLLLPLLACGDDDGNTDGDTVDAGDTPDAEVAATDAAPADAQEALIGDEFNDPSDLPRVDCVPGSLAGFDPLGSWSMDTTTDYGGGFIDKFADAFKVSESIFGEGLEGNYHGRTQDTRFTDDDVFIRYLDTSTSGTKSLYVLDACALDGQGRLSGHFVQCFEFFGTECYHGTFTAVRLGRITGENEAQGLTLISEFRGRANDPWPTTGLTVNVRVKDAIAYVVRLGDGLRVVDISDEANPRDLSRHAVSGGYNDVKLLDVGGVSYALVSSDRRGIDVLDVSDPTLPVAVSNFPGGNVGVHTFVIEPLGGVPRVYLPNGDTGGLDVWDLTDPANPLPLGSFIHPMVETMGGFIHDLSVDNGVVYLNYWNLGFVWVDTADPAAIAIVGEFNSYERRTSHSNWVTTVNGCKVAVHGDEDFGSHLRMVGVDPSAGCATQFQQELGSLSLRPEVSIHNILAFGTTAYIAWYQDGVRVVDVSNPAAPVQTAYFNTWDGRVGTNFFEGAIGIDVDLPKSRIYVADHPRGLMVLSID